VDATRAKYSAVVPAQAGTHCAKYTGLWNMGPRLRGDDIFLLNLTRNRK
jgi:hypothetical protein